MARRRKHCLGHRGISLLEVLMTIFIIAVGLASVFALFLAGREIDSRALRQIGAESFCQSVAEPFADKWCDGSQWQAYNADPTSRRLEWVPSAPTLPVVVDPWGLSGDSLTPSEQNIFTGEPQFNWALSRFIPASLGFRRLTLPATSRPSLGSDVQNFPPHTREAILSSFAGPDEVEFKTPREESLPPQPLFELGRRKRGSTFVPSLFLCNPNNAVAPYASGAAVDRWLLIFHNPAAAYEVSEDGVYTRPFGAHELESPPDAVLTPDLLELKRTDFSSGDQIDLQRAFQPGKWLLVTLLTNRATQIIDHAYWKKIISATHDGGQWLIALEEDNTVPSGWDADKTVRVYAFESLIYVKKIDQSVINGL